jgi:RNA polymerase sigma-70 factor (ECF subfamily)
LGLERHADHFLDLLDTHKGIVYKIARAYARTTEDREDLTQEITLQLWRTLDRYDGRTQWSTWIYRVALNTAISYHRRRQTRQRQAAEWATLFRYEAEEAPGADPRLAQLQAFIQELKPLDKALILLYLDGKSQREMAEIMGLTPTNVSTKVGRIKQRLKQKFLNPESTSHEK